MPRFVEFGSTEPDYAKECKDEADPSSQDFDEDYMNEVGLDESELNPCHWIAGKTLTKEAPMSIGEAAAIGAGAGAASGPIGVIGGAALGAAAAVVPAWSVDTEGVVWYNWNKDLTNKKPEYGVTYDKVFSCDTRGDNRAYKSAQWDFAHDGLDAAINWFDAAFGPSCNAIPNLVIAPMGGGTEQEIKSVCDDSIKYLYLGMHTANDMIKASRDLIFSKASDIEECTTTQIGLARAFCDMHCIRDAVKAGDEAILDSLERATNQLGKHMDALSEWLAGNVLERLDEVEISVLNAVDGASGKEALLSKASDVKRKFGALFQDLQSLAVKGSFDAPGSVTMSRTLDQLASFAMSGPRDGNATQASEHLMLLQQHGEQLQAVLANARRGASVSKAEAVAEQVARYAHRMQQELRQSSKVIGIYQKTSEAQKLRQKDFTSGGGVLARLMAQLEEQQATEMLLKLDSHWWTLRGVLDKYLDASGAATTAYENAFSMLDSYTAECSATFKALKETYAHAMAADRRSKAALKEAWDTATPQLGLMAALVADGDVFSVLARSDVKAAMSMPSNLSKVELEAMCAEAPKQDSSVSATATSKNITEKVVLRVLNGGLVGQTVQQFHVSFREVALLAARRASAQGRMEAKKEDLEELEGSLRRVWGALQVTKARLAEWLSLAISELKKSGACS
eukprot:TRINITY_DN8558_c0_g2_i1.p1 TRINITY_DN8558_c0_g2~~TRINITY_DN8558_c0_g2_i1.p1  ORF type:complete len:682 (+),score=140.03 TRINITY_DN8558_c0_g2_i1:216-2261(+)